MRPEIGFLTAEGAVNNHRIKPAALAVKLMLTVFCNKKEVLVEDSMNDKTSWISPKMCFDPIR